MLLSPLHLLLLLLLTIMLTIILSDRRPLPLLIPSSVRALAPGQEGIVQMRMGMGVIVIEMRRMGGGRRFVRGYNK